MKKLLITFLLFTGISISQISDDEYYYYLSGDAWWIHQAVTEYNTLAAETATIRGSITKTKSDKDNGSKRADGYMRFWRVVATDDTIYQSSFDSDDADSLDGWKYVNANVEVVDSISADGVMKYNVLKFQSDSTQTTYDTWRHYITKNLDNYFLDLVEIQTIYYIPSGQTNVTRMSWGNGISENRDRYLGVGDLYHPDNPTADPYTANPQFGFTTGEWDTLVFRTTHNNNYVPRIIFALYEGHSGYVPDDTSDYAYIADIKVILKEKTVPDSLAGTTYNFALNSGGRALAPSTAYKYDISSVPNGGNDSYNTGEDSTFTTGTDTIPTFAFTDVTEVGLSSYNETGATFSAANDSFWVYAAGDSFKIGALGTLDVDYVKAAYTDTVFISLVASGSYSTAVTSTVTAGGVSDTWSVTTGVEPDYYYVINKVGNKAMLFKTGTYAIKLKD